jgi:hypothetical protein
MKSPKSHACPFTHPQIDRKFANAESKKLCNDATEKAMSQSGAPAPSESDDDFTVAQPVPMA